MTDTTTTVQTVKPNEMTAPQIRKFAQDLKANFAGEKGLKTAVSNAVAELEAKADSINDTKNEKGKPMVAQDAIIEYDYPIIGKVRVQGGKRLPEEVENADGEKVDYNGDTLYFTWKNNDKLSKQPFVPANGMEKGVYVSVKWNDDPSLGLACGSLNSIYIGTDKGIKARYDGEKDAWYACQSNDKFDFRTGDFGVWQERKLKANEFPSIVNQLDLCSFWVIYLGKANKAVPSMWHDLIIKTPKDKAIEKLREAAGIDREELAEMLDMSHVQVVHKYENNTLKVSDQLYTLALLLTDQHPDAKLVNKHDPESPLDLDEAIVKMTDKAQVADIRKEMGLTQAEFAEMLGLSSQQAVNKYENIGTTMRPRLFTLLLLLTGTHPRLSLVAR